MSFWSDWNMSPPPPMPAGNAAWFTLHREARRAEKRAQRGKGKRGKGRRR